MVRALFIPFIGKKSKKGFIWENEYGIVKIIVSKQYQKRVLRF